MKQGKASGAIRAPFLRAPALTGTSRLRRASLYANPACEMVTRYDRRDLIRLGGLGFALPILTGYSSPGQDALIAVRDKAARFIKDGVPGLSIAVIYRGRPIWVEALGWADKQRGIPARTTTRFALASASKPFTATAIAQLITAGRIGLDDPIETYLGGLAIGGRVTVRQALQHRSGIPRHWRNVFGSQALPPPFGEVARDHAFTTYARGKHYLYSNMNYGLLATIVEQVVGRRFHEQLNETIFRPLALTTATSLKALAGGWDAAVPYEIDGTPIPPYRVDEDGARDLVMSAFDLARFGQAHLTGKFGAAGRLMISERAIIGNSGAGRASYGLGWVVDEESPAAMFSYGHTGEGPGAASSLAIVPQEELVVATIANQQGPAAYMLNEMIVDALSPTFESRRKAHPFQDDRPDVAALQSFVGKWVGEVHTPAGRHATSLTIDRQGNGQITLLEGRMPVTQLVVRNGALTGRADLTIPSPEVAGVAHEARIILYQNRDALDGALAAYARRGKVPHDLFWLSYRLSLRRS